MKIDEFNERLAQLVATVGSAQGDELFNELYAELLIDVSKDDDERRKRERAARMRALAVTQGGYLIEAWAKAKAEHDANEATECET